MMALLAAVFAASLAGSFHCAGMCGPLVAFVLNPLDAPAAPRTLLHAAYHGARLVAYALLGALAGGVGAMLDLTGSAIGLERTAAALAGFMIAVIGAATLLRHVGARFSLGRTPVAITHLAQAVQRVALKLAPLPRATLFGVLTALLPCGWLYAFGVTAAGTGSPLWGAAVMGVFWAGTVPWLLAVGVGTQLLARALGPRVPVVAALLLIALGVLTIAGRAGLPRHSLAATTPASHPSEINPTSLPCCHGDGR